MKKIIFLLNGGKKQSRVLFLAFVCAASVLALHFSSCSSIGTVAKLGAAVGQKAGVINASTADAITKTGDAWGKAFEDITPEQEYYIGRAVAANILTT